MQIHDAVMWAIIALVALALVVERLAARRAREERRAADVRFRDAMRRHNFHLPPEKEPD